MVTGGLSAKGIAAASADARDAQRSHRNDALRDGARKALDALHAKRKRTAAVAKAAVKSDKRRKAKDGLPMVDQLVSKEAQQHGDYRAVDFEMADREERGKAKAKTVRVVRNVGGTPVERWLARGKLNEREMAAVLFYQEAFRKVFGEGPKVVASYSPIIIRGFRASIELWAGSTLAAKEALRLLDHEVFFAEDVDWFQVWQNVVIFHEPAGVAGGRVGFVVKKSAEAAALTIVQSLARKIANIVIDSSRRDFSDLLLDLDAPRRPRRRAA